MNKVLVYILLAIIFLSLVFNFVNYYDYTFDFSSSNLDLSFISSVNGSLLKNSFVDVVDFSGKIVSFLNNFIHNVVGFFTPFKTSSQTDIDLQRIELIYDSSYSYIRENYGFLKAGWLTYNLKSFTSFLRKPNLFFSYDLLKFTTYDLEETCSVYGISDIDKDWLHDYFSRLSVRHIYHGELYTF